jgi:glycosyltransferase involved in cell wall biosynthesis
VASEQFMKIAFFTNQYPAPSHTFIRREISALEERGHAVCRYAIRPYSAELRDAADLAEFQKTSHIARFGVARVLLGCLSTMLRRPLGSCRALRLAFRFASAARGDFVLHTIYAAEAMLLANWCLKDEVEHLHVHFGTNPATVAALAHEICGIPYSITVHGPEEFDRASLLGLGLKASTSSFVVAVSSFGRSQLMRWTDPGDWHKLHVVRCGVDGSYRADPAFGVSSEKRLVCIARLGEQKGHLVLLQAAAKLARQGMNFELVLAGDGPLRAQIEAEIERLSLQRVVTLIGSVSQERVMAEIKRARAMVLASFAEGLPVVLMESMALGRPVISTYIAGIPELVAADTGWLVPAGDVDALAEAMRSVLCETTARLDAMGERARQRALALHDVSQSAGFLEELMLPAVGTKRAVASLSVDGRGAKCL